MTYFRRFTRHLAALPLHLNHPELPPLLGTHDVSRRGLFVPMPVPLWPSNPFVQVQVVLPRGKPVSLLTIVRKIVWTATVAAPHPGFGLELVAPTSPALRRWDNFVLGLRHQRISDGYVLRPEALLAQLPPQTVRDWLWCMRKWGYITEVPPAPVPQALPAAEVLLTPLTVARFCALLQLARNQGVVFVQTSGPCDGGRPMTAVVVHPRTDECHPLQAVVERVVRNEDGHYAGVALRFAPLLPHHLAALRAFQDRGIADVLGRDPPELPVPQPRAA